MKRIISLILFLGLTSAFADNENYNGQDVSGQDFSYQSLTRSKWVGATADMTQFVHSNLSSADFSEASLTNANLTGADLTSSIFRSTILKDAIFTDAIISGARFYSTHNSDEYLLTKEQLYSTKSYKDKDLRGVYFASYNDLSGWDFSGQNLTSAILRARITGADFTNAIIAKANFNTAVARGFTKEQLYSTKSYQDKNLSGIDLGGNNLNGWDFSGQNLTEARFDNVRVDGTDFTGADFRGGIIDISNGTPIFRNTILDGYGAYVYCGTIINFSMESADDVLVIRKYWSSKSGGFIVTAKIAEADATVSNGAVLTLDIGAELEVTEGTTFTLANNGNLVINTDAGSSTLLSVESGSGLAFENGAVLRVNVEGEFAPSEGEAIVVMSWADGAHITGTDVFTVNETIFLTVNGEAYASGWNYKVADNQFQIVFAQIPEPAFWAAVLGLVALAFAVRRRNQ